MIRLEQDTVAEGSQVGKQEIAKVLWQWLEYTDMVRAVVVVDYHLLLLHRNRIRRRLVSSTTLEPWDFVHESLAL